MGPNHTMFSIIPTRVDLTSTQSVYGKEAILAKPKAFVKLAMRRPFNKGVLLRMRQDLGRPNWSTLILEAIYPLVPKQSKIIRDRGALNQSFETKQ